MHGIIQLGCKEIVNVDAWWIADGSKLAQKNHPLGWLSNEL
jgi:hypothetical protein